MRHELKLTVKEKINVWIDLCDFSFLLMKNTLSLKQLKTKLNKIRKDHLKNDYKLLTKWSELDK